MTGNGTNVPLLPYDAQNPYPGLHGYHSRVPTKSERELRMEKEFARAGRWVAENARRDHRNLQ